MNSVRLNYLPGCKDIEIRKFEFAAKPQFLCVFYLLVCLYQKALKRLTDIKIYPKIYVHQKSLKSKINIIEIGRNSEVKCP